jgi:1,4-dihydroxy-2-naphthoate octaprenyltransferase
MRAPFLILAVSCAVLGLGVAVWTTGGVRPLDVVIVFIGAVCTHIAVNALNEYFDFRSGLDLKTTRTPFSGGSGTLPAQPALASQALAIGLGALAIALAVGIYFLIVRGWALLPIGLAGVLVIVAYTPLLTRNAILCLIAPGLGFGPLMVVGVAVALTGQYTWPAFIASLAPFFLVSDLLLLNQFPDVEADRSVGRKHLLIVAGRRAGSLVYSAFLLLAYVTIILGVVFGWLPPACLLGLLTLFAAVPAIVGANRHAADIPKLVPSLVMNVLVNLLTPALVGIGLLIS